MGGILGIILGLNGYSGDDIRTVLSDTFTRVCISYMLFFTYFFLIEGLTKGRSLGKLITKTVAVKDDLSPITWKDALMRSLSRAVPFEPFSALNGNPWHDKWTHTTVIKKPNQF